MYNTLKVKKIVIENMRKIWHVEIEKIDKNFNVISWKNWSWKTTLLDAIFFAIIGRTHFDRGVSLESIIKKWADKMSVELVLESSGEKINIKRKLTAKGNTDYVAIDWDLNELSQKELQEIIQQYSIDPLAFTRMKPKDQVEELKSILWIDTKKIDHDISSQMDKAKLARAIDTEKKKALKDIWTPEAVKAVDTADLATQLSQAELYNSKKKELQGRISVWEWWISDIDDQIAALQKSKAEAEEKLSHLKDEYKDGYSKKEIDISPIQKKISEAAETNRKATIFEKYLELEAEAMESWTVLEKHKMILEELREDRLKLLSDAKLPIEWMTMDETDGIMIDGVMITQLSSAEQILIATKIIAHTNPALKLIYIKDWSLLDDEKFDEIEKFAKAWDYQFFVEVVGEQMDSIILSEGEVKKK